MKKLLFAIVMIAFISKAIAQTDKVVTGENVETRQLKDFSSIHVSNGIELLITKGDDEAVAVGATEIKYRDRIKTEVKDGQLKIWYEWDNKVVSWGNDKKKSLKAYVSYKALNNLIVSSGASVKHSDEFVADILQVSVSSGGILKFSLKVEKLSIKVVSGAVSELSGSAKSIDIIANSGAIFKGYNLQTEDCNASATSGGSIKITVNKELTAKANSGGGISYKGSGLIKNIDTGSGGSVKRVTE